MKHVIVSLLAFVILFSSCDKKDKPEPTVSLAGKWKLESTVYKEYVNNALQSTTTAPADGTTFDFQSNGNVVITHPGNVIESFTYTILPNSKVKIEDDTFDIKNLLAATVSLYIRQDYAAGEYDEVMVNLKR